MTCLATWWDVIVVELVVVCVGVLIYLAYKNIKRILKLNQMEVENGNNK